MYTTVTVKLGTVCKVGSETKINGICIHIYSSLYVCVKTEESEQIFVLHLTIDETWISYVNTDSKMHPVVASLIFAKCKQVKLK